MDDALFETVDAQYVQDHIGDVPIIDVRPAEFYAAAHIPTSLSVPLMAIVDASDGYLDAAAQSLAAHVRQAGIMPHDELVVYCQTGHLATEACVLLLAMGYDRLRCYRGSWTDWSSDSSRPISQK